MWRAVLIDDECAAVNGIKQLVEWERLGIELIGTAVNGEEGLNLIREKHPEIIITDIRMPKINGLKVIEEAKKFLPDSVFIVISGYSEFVYAKQALCLGVLDYVEKPITVEQITETLMKATAEICKRSNRSRQSEKLEKIQLETEIKANITAGNIKRSSELVRKYVLLIRTMAKDDMRIYEDGSFYILDMMEEAAASCHGDYSEECLNGRQIKAIFMDLDKREREEWLISQVEEVTKWISVRKAIILHPCLSRALESIHTNYADLISLQSLADEVGMNASYLSGLFKRQLGVSYIRYLTGVRLEHAKEELSKGYKVLDVCHRVGFQDTKHFLSIFKHRFGITPEQAKLGNNAVSDNCRLTI